jgi:16S rRNA (guanine527-N7)-methyltransferase
MSGDADSQAAGLVGVLARSRELGFLGPGPLDEQIAHSRAFGELVGEFVMRGPSVSAPLLHQAGTPGRSGDGFPGRFLDLGAGGGLPGLVLLEAWPEATALLVDAQEKRCRFLAEALAELGWEHRAEVRCGRAEALARNADLRGSFSLVVARGFGPPPVTAECAVGFLSSPGTLAVTEPPEPLEPPVPPGVPRERWPADGLAQLGFAPAVLLRSGQAGAACLEIAQIPAERWPRRDGVPGKRPLW